MFKFIFRVPTANELAVQHCEEMKRMLLEVSRKREYYNGMEMALKAGIARLEMQTDKPKTPDFAALAKSVGMGISK